MLHLPVIICLDGGAQRSSSHAWSTVGRQNHHPTGTACVILGVVLAASFFIPGKFSYSHDTSGRLPVLISLETAISPLNAVQQMFHIVGYCGLHGVGMGVVFLVIVREYRYLIAIILTSATANVLPRCVGVGQTKIDHASPAISRR